MFDNKNFYPTPKTLLNKMLNKVDMSRIKYVLEPSAGKGDIINGYKDKYIINHRRMFGYLRDGEDRFDKYVKVDAVEYNDNLRNTLRGQGLNIIGSDFLELDPPRFYDLIIMNPPFDNGVNHLLKAIEIQERMGGQIVCVLNANTLKNAYSVDRVKLLSLLDKYNAEIEYLQNEFSNAERKTDVEIALINLNINMKDNTSIFEKNFKREMNVDLEDEISFTSIVPKMNKLESLIFEYETIKKSTIELYMEHKRITGLLNGFGLASEINLCNSSYKPEKLSVNDFISSLNLKYWNKFINETEFKQRIPSKLRNEFNYNMERQKNIAFTMENLQYFYNSLMLSVPKSYEETVAKLLEDVTHKYCYTESAWNKTIHYYDGWKTNKAYKINKKVIIPIYTDSMYRIPDILMDLNIVFENISKEKDEIDKSDVLDRIKANEKKIETKHFTLDSYKKGTLHITFNNEEHLKIFNILACKGKNWLPADFGDKPYSKMTEEEKQVVKNFGLTEVEYDYICISGNARPNLKLLN